MTVVTRGLYCISGHIPHKTPSVCMSRLYTSQYLSYISTLYGAILPNGTYLPAL